jgi:hypothetical protein
MTLDCEDPMATSAVMREAGQARLETGLPSSAILLNCFGRGGSSMVWNIIGSSPDVLMPNREWHQGVFGRFDQLRKTARLIGSMVNWAHVPAFRRHAVSATARTVPAKERMQKPGARHIVLKVMDYHIVFDDAISWGFGEVHHIVLARHPLAMCEGLMRSGLSESRAIKWYNDVTMLMSNVATRHRAVVTRFEDLIHAPDRFARDLYRTLGVPAAEDGTIRFKVKSYGEGRMRNADVATGEIRRISLEQASSTIAPDVNATAIARLNPAQRKRIWASTQSTAALFDYVEDSFRRGAQTGENRDACQTARPHNAAHTLPAQGYAGVHDPSSSFAQSLHSGSHAERNDDTA